MALAFAGMTSRASLIMAMTTIHIQSASLSYHQQEIFSDLNLVLPAGRFTCLLGPSGVGKSSLLHWLAHAGQLPGMKGQLLCDKQTSLYGQVALMTQQDGLLPWLSAIDNVVFGYHLRQQSVAEKYQQAKELLNALGLNDNDVKKLPKALSGGMRQRVALARTLLENKQIVLLDEPFSALDAITRFSLQALIAKFLRGKTVLLVTHDPLEALRLADEIYLMQGKPANLQLAYSLSSPSPRDISSLELLAMQSQLLNMLSE